MNYDVNKYYDTINALSKKSLAFMSLVLSLILVFILFVMYELTLSIDLTLAIIIDLVLLTIFVSILNLLAQILRTLRWKMEKK